MSCAELFEPITTSALARVTRRATVILRWSGAARRLKASMPRDSAACSALPDMPVASTSCFGTCSVTLVTRAIDDDRPFLAGRRRTARVLHSVPTSSRFSSITLAYISSQSPILSLGENTGQFIRERQVRHDGRTRPGRAGRATCSDCASCRRRVRFFSTMSVGTPSWRSRAPSADAALAAADDEAIWLLRVA